MIARDLNFLKGGNIERSMDSSIFSTFSFYLSGSNVALRLNEISYAVYETDIGFSFSIKYIIRRKKREKRNSTRNYAKREIQ